MSASEPGGSRRPRRRVAVGPRRPQYLHDVENDRMMMIVTALVAEVSTLRDRLDTHEELAARGVAATREAIEAYEPDEATLARREELRTALLKRVYRVLMEELDALTQVDGAKQGDAWAMPDEWSDQ